MSLFATPLPGDLPVFATPLPRDLPVYATHLPGDLWIWDPEAALHLKWWSHILLLLAISRQVHRHENCHNCIENGVKRLRNVLVYKLFAFPRPQNAQYIPLCSWDVQRPLLYLVGLDSWINSSIPSSLSSMTSRMLSSGLSGRSGRSTVGHILKHGLVAMYGWMSEKDQNMGLNLLRYHNRDK